ncbi:hypothetical protein M0Q97_09035 [Candidatus Dojkabacteria bacterium]|jgi:hypothetical protein|nr:hypothetical protein [Candidatus Dojkabacteria bacterium]
MKDYKFYEYDENNDTIKIYGDDISNYFLQNYVIIIDSIDFDECKNVILYIEDIKNNNIVELEQKLLNSIEHLNDVEIKKTKIILTFNTKEIELN